MTIAALRALIDDALPGPERTPVAATTDQPPLPTPTVNALINWGHAHQSPAIRRHAEQAHDALAALRTSHHAAAELAQLAAQEAELEERLAQLRARRNELKPSPRSRAVSTPGALRTFAREHQIPCPDRGPIPAAVREAWREYQAGLRLQTKG